MKRSTEWLVFLLFWAIVFAIERTILSDTRHGDPIRIWVMICVTVIFWLGLMLYLWRADLSGFLKRVLIAVPFASIFAVFMIILTGTLAISVFALSVYLFLLYKTPSWKQHFSVTLILASILAVALKFSYAILNPHVPQEISIYRTLFPTISIVFIGFFYGLYIRKVKDGETINLHSMFVRMLKFIAAFGLYFAGWLAFQVLGERQQISLLISLMVSGVLTIVFLVICYLFDLFPIERKKKIKTESKLSELQDELTDLYQEESRKLKMYKREK